MLHKPIFKFMQNVIFSIPEPEFKTMIQDAVKMVLNGIEPQQQTPNAPELLTRNETAKYLGVSLPTLNFWTKNGVILGYRIAGRVRYKRPDIEKALLKIDSIKYRRAV
jgi:excisionase family DNA binding protein